MMKQKNECHSRVPGILAKKDLNKIDLSDHYQGASYSSLYRWTKGEWPPVNVLLQMAKEEESNVAYVLGITNVNVADERYDTPVLRLKSAIEEAGITHSQLAKMIGTSTRIVKEYIDNPRFSRVTTLANMAEALGVSIDYLLGLTSVKSWEYLMVSRDPFYLCCPGEPARVVSKKGKSCYCLIHEDGDSVIFPTGEIVKKNSDLFEGGVAYPIKETVNEADTVAKIKSDGKAHKEQKKAKSKTTKEANTK